MFTPTSTSLRFYATLFSLLWYFNIKVFSQATYAVVVGVSNYQKFRPLKGDLHFASRDAQLFYSYLTSVNGQKVPKSNVILLLNDMATKPNILNALKLFTKAKTDDQVIFYFSGHGDSGVFLPYETSGIKIFVSHKEVKEAFKNCNARLKLCIADACKSGTIKKQSFPEKDEIQHVLNTNVIVFLSSLANQLSGEYGRLGQGVFTFYLLKALQGEADKNQDQSISALELYQYVNKNVRQYSKKYSPDKKEQIPTMYGRFSKDLILANY